MSFQLKSVITSYFNFEIITRFDIRESKAFPVIYIRDILTNFNKLQEKYPAMKTEINKMNKTDQIKIYYNAVPMGY